MSREGKGEGKGEYGQSEEGEQRMAVRAPRSAPLTPRRPQALSRTSKGVVQRSSLAGCPATHKARALDFMHPQRC